MKESFGKILFMIVVSFQGGSFSFFSVKVDEKKQTKKSFDNIMRKGEVKAVCLFFRVRLEVT